MLHIAEKSAAQGKFSPMFLISWEDHARSVDICEARGYAYTLYGVLENPTIEPTHSEFQAEIVPQSKMDISALIKRAKSIVKSFSWVLLIWYLIQFNRDKRFAKKLLIKQNVACVLLIADRHAGIETALVEMANRHGIPSLIVPFAISDAEGSAVYRQATDGWPKIYGLDNYKNRVIARMKPEWVYTHNGVPLLWNPVPWLLAATISGIMPTNPWVLGGGSAWLMAVESQYHQDSFERQGAPVQKMFVSGKPRYDLAAQILQNQNLEQAKICQNFDFDESKSLLVCSVPQMAEHNVLPWLEHWQEVDFLFSSLASLKPDVNILLTLHPKSEYSQYLPRAEKYGLTIAREHTYDQLIPLCDIFVATFSSTVTLAIACQKPAIVIDFYGLGYDFFDQMPGIVVCRTHEEFNNDLTQIFSEQNVYERMAEGQALSAEYWARFDGKATERILDTVDELVAKSRAFRKLAPRKRRQVLPPWSQ
jgi:hypothetical protein